jgi:hypothetical protein
MVVTVLSHACCLIRCFRSALETVDEPIGTICLAKYEDL